MIPGTIALAEDDAPPPLLLHVGPHLFCAVEGPGQVDRDVAVPQPVLHVLDLGHVVQRGCVIDEDVDASELVLDALEDVAHLVAVGDVHLDRDRAPAHLPDRLRGLVRIDPALCGGHLCQGRVGAFRRRVQVGVVLDQDVGDHHIGAGLGERQRVLPSKPSGSPGDDGNLA
jgi:hypothetical protein